MRSLSNMSAQKVEEAGGERNRDPDEILDDPITLAKVLSALESKLPNRTLRSAVNTFKTKQAASPKNATAGAAQLRLQQSTVPLRQEMLVPVRGPTRKKSDLSVVYESSQRLSTSHSFRAENTALTSNPSFVLSENVPEPTGRSSSPRHSDLTESPR